MDVRFERKGNSQEWYTPPEIVNALGIFDIDPCAPVKNFYTAKQCYTKEEDGLTKSWEGRVWLNPPYVRPEINQFIQRMIKHNNGIALVFNRMDTALWHKSIFSTASAILIMRGRIRFYNSEGIQGMTAGCGSILVAWGKENAVILKDCGIEGKYFEL